MRRLYLILLVVYYTAAGQEMPARMSASPLSVNALPSSATATQKLYDQFVKKNDWHNAALSALLLSESYRKVAGSSAAIRYDVAAEAHARQSGDTVLLQKTLNTYVQDMAETFRLAEAVAIITENDNLFTGQLNTEACTWQYTKAVCSFKQMKYDAAIAECNKGILLAAAIGDTAGAMQLQMFAGRIYIMKGRSDSVGLAFKAFEYFNQLHHYINAARAASVIGFSFQRTYSLDKALGYYNRAVELSLINNDINNAEQFRLHTGDILLAQKNYEAAMRIFTTGYRFFSGVNQLSGMAAAALRLGQLCTETGQYDSAKIYLDIAIGIGRQLQADVFKIAATGQMIILQNKMGNPKSGDSAAREAMKLLSKYNDKDVTGDLYDKLKDSKVISSEEAAESNRFLDVQVKPVQIAADTLVGPKEQYKMIARTNWLTGSETKNDSTILEKNNRQIQEMDAKYRLREKDDSIKNRDQQLMIERLEAKQKQIESGQQLQKRDITIVASILLLALVAAGMFVQYKSRRRAETDKAKIELLQNEIHHRVKNNLAVLNRVVDIAGKDNMENIPAVALKNRIKSIELLHQHLYSNEAKTGNISLQAYFTDLCTAIAATFETTKNISLTVNAPVEIESHIAEKLGLIINELVTNSYKYAFAERETGSINITAQTDGKMIHLVVQDNGIGMQTGKNVKSYGMKLIKGLSNELSGKFGFENVEGTVFRLAVPLTLS